MALSLFDKLNGMFLSSLCSCIHNHFLSPAFFAAAAYAGAVGWGTPLLLFAVDCCCTGSTLLVVVGNVPPPEEEAIAREKLSEFVSCAHYRLLDQLICCFSRVY